MIAVTTFKIALICFNIVLISSFLLQQQQQSKQTTEESSNSHPSLGFANQTGSNTTTAQVTSFINFINSASTFYRDDIKARLGYISDQMNKTYGVSGRGYSIIQQGNESFFGFGVHSNVYASVAPGVDKVFSSKSYMFIQDPIYSTDRTFFTLVGSKGSGINRTLQAAINNTILTVETTSNCTCSGSSTIADKLKVYDSGTWNVICSISLGYYFFDVYVKSDKYFLTKPKNCYYGIFAV